ncbi:MAG: hypothetical protein Q7K20_07820 [Polaromonas sp.]|nr:hypothetical protein [Polaromonas sp.]
MEMLLRAKILTFLLGICTVGNLFLLLYPTVLLGSKTMHAVFFAYALFGFMAFRWVLKVGETNPDRADTLFVRCIFAYWGVPVLLAYLIIAMGRN